MLAARPLLLSDVFDCDGLLNEYYEEHVRLGKARRDELARHRDANLERLSAGLEKLGPITGSASAGYDDYLLQGSYAMHTLNQHPDNDYDIDTGVIFLYDDIPTDAKEARERLARALRNGGGNFSRPPQARTNAVTAWYAAGHHVDLAIYRRNGSSLEHAGGDTWNRCEPEQIPAWFKTKNIDLSPVGRAGQFRRVVRWTKAFAKSRKTWNMPGGMILSALVAECYRPHESRDDVALLDTFTAISQRLSFGNLHVGNPAGGSLTGKQKYLDRVGVLRDKLKWVLPKLEVLRDADCTEGDAKRAWRWVFNHSFWETAAARAVVLAEAASAPEPLKLRVHLADTLGGRAREEYREGVALAKGRWIQFSADGVRLSGSDRAHWIVENTGEEAVANDDLGHATPGQSTFHEEKTAYTGTHRLICEVRRGNVVLARGVSRVTVR
jgi:hypothetical protein